MDTVVSKTFLSSVSHSSKLIKPEGGVTGTANPIAGQSEAQVITWVFDSCLKCVCRQWLGRGSLVKTDPLTCGIRRSLQVDSVRIELNCRTLSWCCRISWK